MLTLIRKDLRLLRPVMLTAIWLAVLFCGVLPAFDYWQWQPPGMRTQTGVYPETRSDFLLWSIGRGVVFMWLAWPVLGAVIGGVAFAQERRERWADLTGVLPIPRGKIVFAKAVTSVGVLAAMAVGILLIIGIMGLADAGTLGRWGTSHDRTFQIIVAGFVSVTVLLFTTAWLGSSLLSSATVAAGVAIAGCGGAFIWVMQWYIVTLPKAVHSFAMMTFAGVSALVGCFAFVVGCGVQIGRRSP